MPHMGGALHSCDVLMESGMRVSPNIPPGTAWIDELSDEQCGEIFWLYVEEPEQFLARYPAPLLGAAMRLALRLVAAQRGQPDRVHSGA